MTILLLKSMITWGSTIGQGMGMCHLDSWVVLHDKHNSMTIVLTKTGSAWVSFFCHIHMFIDIINHDNISPYVSVYLWYTLCVYIYIHIYTHNYIYIYAKYMYNCTHPNSCNSQNIDFFMYLGKFFLTVFLRAKNRACWCSPSCKRSWSRSCSLLQLLG